MNILNFKIILSIIIGMFLYISHMMIYREMVTRSDFVFCSAVFFLLFLLFWTGIGILFSPFKKGEKPHFLFPMICITPASLASLLLIQLLTTYYPVNNYANLALVAFAGCFPLGITFGIMFISAKHSVSLHFQDHVTFFGALGYLAIGLIVYPLALFNVMENPTVYTLTSNGLILLIALVVFRFKRAQSVRLWFLTFAMIVISTNFMLLLSIKSANKNFFATRYSKWQLINQYLTHYNNLTLLGQQVSDKAKRFMLVKNTKTKLIIPDDSQLYKTNIIPFTLQPNKKSLRVLAIGSPFSFIPRMISSLPYIRHVTLVTASRNTMPITLLNYFSPPPSSKIKIIDIETNKYLKENKSKFDLIIWLSPNQEYLNFDTMIKLCHSKMTKDGVLAIPASLLATNNAQKTCKEIFKNEISLPGKSLVYAFSNGALTNNLKLLEKRLDKLDDRENKLFPLGTFAIIYSTARKKTSLANLSNKNGIENLLIKHFRSLKINIKHILIIFVVSCIYFIGRFFVLRRKRLHTEARIFENGLCLMLLMMILMTLYAQHEGAFFYNFGVILTAISAVPAGFVISRFKVQRLTVIMSIAVILLSALYWREYYVYFIPSLAYINFLCGGIIIANIFKQNPDVNIKLLAVHFLACALGVALMFTLLILHFNLLSCLFILILFRIPLIFSKMALGKIKNTGAR